MRRVAILGLTLLALVGCDQPSPTQTETPSKPQLSEQKFVFDKSVTWAAYQKDGKWQALELSQTADTTLSFTNEQAAISYVCDDSNEENASLGQLTLYFSHATLAQYLTENLITDATLPIACDYPAGPPMPEQPAPTAKVRGKVLGLGDSERVVISFRGEEYRYGDAYTQFMMDGSLEYQSYNSMYPGTYTVSVTVFPEGSATPSRALILPDAFTMQDAEITFDIDLTNAVALSNYTFSLKGLKNPSFVYKSAYGGFVTLFDSQAVPTNAFSTSTTFSYAAFPNGYSLPVEYGFNLSAQDGDCFHTLSATVKTAKDLEASVLSCPVLTFENSLRPSLAWNFGDGETSDMIGVVFGQGRALSNVEEGLHHAVEVAFIGNVPTTNKHMLEDFSNLAGWKAEWALKNEATFYSFHGEDRQSFFDGNLFRSVQLKGEYKPAR